MSQTIQMQSSESTEQPPVEQPPLESVETNKGIQFKEPSSAPERPDWLPQKFQSPEDLAKAYSELESKLGASGGGRIAPPPTPPKAPAGSSEEISFATAVEEFQKDGSVSDKTYAKYAEKGLSKAAVDGYIAGQQALAERQQAILAETVGGADQFRSLLEWAGKNLTPAEMEGYNSQIDAGNLEAAKVMLTAFNSRFITQNGKEPKLVNGAPAKTDSEGGFPSQAAMLEAMRDPRYQSDPNYREHVVRRLAKTTAF